MAAVASESNAVQALMHKFLALLRNYREPVTDAEVREYFQSEGQGEYEKLPSVLNVLMSEGKIKIFQKGNVLSYGVIGAEEAERIRGLTLEQRLVLQEIERAGNKGIWTRDIKTHTNIPQQIVTKTLRLLETRRLVKSVKSISSKNKKLYMLFDLVPSAEITGGPWYNEQEFDHVFIDTLSTFVYEVIKASGMSTLNAITDKVHASGISKVALGPEEIRSIIQTLMYDGRVEEVRAVRLTPGASHETKYKVSQEISTFNFLSETPCGVCPLDTLPQTSCIVRAKSRMECHHQAHTAPSPSLSLMRTSVIANSSTTTTTNNISTSADRRVPSVQLHGAGAAHDVRERVIPMTPTLMASFPSQAPQSHETYGIANGIVPNGVVRMYCMKFVVGAESPYHTHSGGGNSGQSGGSGSNYSLRRGLGRERQPPQWFTAAPLLSQFYNSQPPPSLLPPPSATVAQSPSHLHHQHRQDQDPDDDQQQRHDQSAASLRTRGYEHYRFPSDAISHHRQHQQHPQQHFYPRRLSHFELRGDETSPLLAAISSAPAPPFRTSILSSPNDDRQHSQYEQHREQQTAPPAKKRKKTAFRLRNFLCMHPGCGKSFTDNAHLRDHTFVHTGEKSLSCETCGKSFARLSTLHDHQRVHSGERPYSCSHSGCEKRYSSRAALRFHVAGHASVNRQRSVGDTTSSNTNSAVRSGAAATHHPVTSESLVLHRAGIHESRRSPVLEPGIQFPLQPPQHRSTGVASPPLPPPIANDTLYLHAKIQTQQTQIAELQAELQKLKRNAKKKKTQQPSSTTTVSTSKPNRQGVLAAPMVAPVLFLMDGMKPFQCFVCYHKFANFFQLSFHAKQHPEAAISDVVRSQVPLPVGPKFCPEADCEYAEKNQKPLKNLQTLKRHWQRRHQLSRPYVCALCSPSDPKTFKTKENLKAHEKDCKGSGAAAVSVRESAKREHAVEAT